MYKALAFAINRRLADKQLFSIYTFALFNPFIEDGSTRAIAIGGAKAKA